MMKYLLVLAMVIGLAVFGCGEQPDTAGDGDGQVAGEVTEGGGETDVGETDAGEGDVAPVAGGEFTFETPELAVGQWIEFGVDEIEFGVDELPETVKISVVTAKISVVDSEVNQGTECLWVQLSGDDFVAQILEDPSGLDIAMQGYQVQLDIFFTHDPARHEDAASALAELTLPSDDAERKHAEALLEAMGRLAVAEREFFSAVEEYVDPAMSWILTEDGSLYQYPVGGNLLSLQPVDGFPTEIGLGSVEARAALRQAAADLGLEECAPPEEE